MNELWALVEGSRAVLASICATLGLVVGSFLNVVVHRLPRILEHQWRTECAELNGVATPEPLGMNLASPRSACPSCGHRIGARDNVPILSWLLLRGRCRACTAPISPRYPLVEAISGVVAAYIAWRFGPTVATAGYIAFAWAMIALAFIDLDTLYLPDSITLPLLWLGLLLHLGEWLPGSTLTDAVIGAAAGYLSLWTVFWLFKLATGKEGMGYGDFKLLAAIGAWLGWKSLPVVILFSSIVGAVAGIALIAMRRQGRDIPIPFGPYLVVAGLIYLFWGPQIVARYMQFFPL